MTLPICARCMRPATAVIPAREAFVCNDHAEEFWRELLRAAVSRPRSDATPEQHAAP